MNAFTYQNSPLVITLPATGFIGQKFTITCNLAGGDNSAGWVVKIPETVIITENKEQINAEEHLK